MRICTIAILTFLSASATLPEAQSAPSPVSVFEAGQDGYKVFRIPAIVAAANGDLLAFCEARQGGDASEIDLVLKRSSDDGQTWGPLETVQESDDFASLFEKDTAITIGNPAPVVDHLDPKHPGRIWLPFTVENNRVFVISSDDHGVTWSKRREITADVKKPDWGWYATGPVHSIQIQRGPHRGRLVIPTDHRIGDDGADRGANGAHAVLSDDHGKTWRLGAIDATYEDGLNANETTVVELNDGSLYFNTRDQHGDAPGTRGETWSRDGGETFESRSPDWKQFRPASAILDLPVVQGALLRIDDDLILFSGPDENGPSGKGRSDMRLRYSTDEAETWRDGPLLHTGPAAYSDMVRLSGNRIGVLFEAGDAGQKNTYQRIVFTSLSALQAQRPAIAAEPPNVLFIAVDDMNDWIGCLGHPQAVTPNIDRLAARGTLFTNAHCTVSVCNPSRAAVMTGLRPETTGVFENNHRLRKKLPDLVTLPQHFRQNGYRVEGGGKIYHDVPPFCDDPESWDDYFWWSEHGPKGGKAGGGFRSPYSIPPDPEPTNRPTRKITAQTKRNFDWGAVDHPESDWPDHQVTTWASDFLSEPRERPFFLAVGIFRPHVPWFNPPNYFEQYPLDEIELPPVKDNDVHDLGPWARKRAMDGNSKHAQVVEHGEWKPAVQAYLASISHADANLGRVLDALDAGPHADNTIIVFWSDHGYHLGEKGHWHKRTLWERATRVPLIVVAPNVTTPGTRCSRPVNLIDLYPTLIDLTGVAPRNELAGHSLVSLLRDSAAEWKHPSITTYLPGNHAIRTERYRYIRYKTGDEELYDHETDPHEWHNLASDPEFQPVIQRLAAKLPSVEP